jgi:tetraacyldisaccharide 4'-kinase
LLDLLYGQAMRLRRRRVARRPDLQRRLAKPVISVGNLSVGGTGKTPVVAEIARGLIAAGHRPSILSRGYARTDAADGVVVVSDGRNLVATIDQSGDEPLMLARQLPGAVVCVSPDRYLSGTLAEQRLGATVHILDDGFQHIELARDLDVLVTTIGEIPNGRVIPMGRLREPRDAAATADILVVSDATRADAAEEAQRLGIARSCGAVRTLGAPIPLGVQVPQDTHGRVLAVAGIANASRFFDALKPHFDLVETMAFDDHHRYTQRDVAAIDAKMRSAGAEAVLTTDKDAVRLEALTLPFSAYRVPLQVQFDPPDVLMSAVMAIAFAEGPAPGVLR